MILIDNINYLKDKYPAIREQLGDIEEKKDKEFTVEKAKSGDETLTYTRGGIKTYFHSKYDPIREAKAILEEYDNVEDKDVIFYGTGLAYHIDIFIKENPNNDFYIFESKAELMEKFLSIRNLTRTEYRNLKGIGLGLEGIQKIIENLIKTSRRKTILIGLPIHRQVFEKEYSEFYQMFLNIVKSKRSSIATNYAFQRRWIINSMINFKDVLSTPNILLEKKGEFIDKPAILVAAGPSLNEEIENIRYIKEEGLAYIFSVGSAINTLIHHNIYPDAATTYDPGKFNQKVFEKVKEREINNIPLIFGSSVGYETLKGYPGDMYHMITSQDKVAEYFLSDEESKIDIVLDAPSIAVVTLQLLSNLGFNPIILAGQNLGYVGTARHSEGVHYSQDLTDAELEKALWVEDVHGNQIRTNDGFNRMRQQLESYIGKMDKGRVINTTKGGAKINGTEFRELREIVDSDLRSKVVLRDWLKGGNTNYKKEIIEERVKAMDAALEESYKWIKEYRSNMTKMHNLIRNRNFNQLNKMYKKLDISIKSLETNSFFSTFILPINRVEHGLLADAVKASRYEKDLYKRNTKLLNEYRVFIEKCSIDIDKIKPVYERMKEEIKKYINKEGSHNYVK